MKDFIPYQQALELAKLNFNEKCFGYYGLENELYIEISCNLDSNLTRRNFIATPTFSQAFRWFRENYEYIPHVFRNSTSGKYSWKIDDRYSYVDYTADIFNTYEEAELACLIKLIEIIKNK
jgi:hypothetical protein